MKNYIATIQELLCGRNEDFDATPASQIKFVRHKDSRGEVIIRGKVETEFSIYETYKHNRQKFLDYQGEQSQPVFNNVKFVVAFLGETSTSARFIGVYRNNGLTGEQFTEGVPHVYNLSEVDGFDCLKERVIIDWGKSAISWHQYFTNEKYVIRIEEGMEDAEGIPHFKSYSDINLPYLKLKRIFEKEPDEWKTALQAVNCIYIITDHTNGKHYIGSTYDKGGMWKRWAGYAGTGHNENLTLKAILAEDPARLEKWSWAVLETLPLNITDKEAIHRENLYKEKFLTREFGYNNN